MPLVPNFTTSQTAGSPSVINIEDTSTGSDVAVTQRRVYLQDWQGNYVVPSGTTTNYIQWSIGQSTIAIDCLTEDMALEVTVEWLNVSNVSLYDKTELVGFTLYNETFYYSMTQAQAAASTPTTILQDTTFLQNKSNLRLFIDSGDQAVVLGYDIVSAQQCYNLATNLNTNQDFYY
jgi:hypothetical protein